MSIKFIFYCTALQCMHCLTLLALHCIALYCIPIGRRMNMFFLLRAFTWQSLVVLQIITNPWAPKSFILHSQFVLTFILWVFSLCIPTRNVTPRCRVDLRCFIFTQGHSRVLAWICMQIVTPSLPEVGSNVQIRIEHIDKVNFWYPQVTTVAL